MAESPAYAEPRLCTSIVSSFTPGPGVLAQSALHADFGWIVPKLIASSYSITQGERD